MSLEGAYTGLDTKKSVEGVQPMKRAVYSMQFKMAAVKLAGGGSSSVKEVAGELGISVSSFGAG